MALIKCPECGHQVSDKAKTCPGCGIEIAGNIVGKKKKSHPVAITITIAFIISLVVALAGFYYINEKNQQNETIAFQRAITSEEPLIMQDYLLRYPHASRERRDSVEKVLARLQKIELDWQNAYASKSRSTLKAFIEQNPQNKHVREARLTIDSLDWVLACERNSVESYEAYLKEYSNQGEHSDEAVMKRDEVKALLEAEEKALQDSIAANSLLDVRK